ncbi:MAG: endolytic transglycosylase MltG [Lachnospiraceae bacterium]|nr:endolytic transglycosylase MltG [Lachnospiraceae bacterium]
MKVIDVTVSFIGTVIRAVVLIACIVLVINIGKKAYDFGFRVFTEGPVAEAPGRDIVMSVDKGEGLKAIAEKLEEKGITSDWALFFIQAKLSEYKGSIDPGTYTLNNSMTTDEIMAVLTKAEIESTGEEDGEYIPSELQEGMEEAIDPGAPVEAGSDLVDGDLEEGETPYEGEDGEIEIENTEDDSEPSIDIQVGE